MLCVNRNIQLIENVFELDTKTVPSAMTARDSIIFFDRLDNEELVKQKISEHPHTKFLVCEDVIDHVIGYVDTKDILVRIVQQQSLSLRSEGLLKPTLMIPDSSPLHRERSTALVLNRQRFCCEVLNEY